MDSESRMASSISVSTIMTEDVMTIGPDATALDAAKIMREHRIGCLPVTEGEALVGIITRSKVPGDKAEVVELIGLYWHFVDVVWVVIFTLVYLIPA